MRQRFITYLQSKRAFWKFKRLWESVLSFSFFKYLYRIRFTYREETLFLRLLRESFGNLFLYALLAAFFIFVFEYLASLSPIAIPVIINTQDLGLFISTIVTVSGVFLGLYFTAVSAVAGNLFMRATEDLQNLFVREKKGQQYIKTLALTTVIGVFYLLLRALNYPISPFGPLAVAILAAYAVIRFMTLGFRTFYFIHPIEAGATITGDIAHAIHNATNRGFGWEKPFLQNHYRRQAEYGLATLKSLIRFGIEAVKLSEEQLLSIGRYAGGLLTYYITEKRRISSESLWYKTKPQFQNWILADSTELALALSTGTPLSPKNIKDRTWFEADCVDLVLQLFDHFLSRQQWESAHACIEILVSVMDRIGPELYDDAGRLALAKITAAIRAALSSTGIPGSLTKERLALVDAYGRIGIAMLIGLFRYIDKRTAQTLVGEIAEIKWTVSDVYNNSLPGQLVSHLETIARQYQAEYTIEGKTVSPEWYLITLTAQQYLFSLKQYHDFVMSLHTDLYAAMVEVFINDKNFLLAAHLVQRWLEFTSKLGPCDNRLHAFIGECASLRKVHDLPWVVNEPDKERSLVESYNNGAVDKLVQLLPILAGLPQSPEKDLPDYFGQAYTFGVEACYQACLGNDVARFKKLFPVVFYGSLAAYDTTRRQVEGWAPDSQIVFPSEPLEDLLTLSGYARLYSELFANAELWTGCEDTWNTYLAGTDAKGVIRLIVATSDYRDGLFAIMPKAVLRGNWDMALRSKLEEMNLAIDRHGPPFLRTGQGVHHPSPLIRLVAGRSSMLSVDAKAVFLVTYLSRHPGAQGITFRDRWDLGRQLTRESRPESGTTNANEEDSQ